MPCPAILLGARPPIRHVVIPPVYTEPSERALTKEGNPAALFADLEGLPGRRLVEPRRSVEGPAVGVRAHQTSSSAPRGHVCGRSNVQGSLVIAVHGHKSLAETMLLRIA